MERLPTQDWKSLTLVRTKASFEKDYFKSNRWRACFCDGRGNGLELRVTDPAILPRLKELGGASIDCLLTISLAGPWAPKDGAKPPMCYKLVAGVMEL
ncbi:MAG: hypothetical protein M0R22_03975 [Dehalococcoidia bacterium]|jgi:hypothetical protein|nr:hypothetical protein [Dehalococcoidia bacterium]